MGASWKLQLLSIWFGFIMMEAKLVVTGSFAYHSMMLAGLSPGALLDIVTSCGAAWLLWMSYHVHRLEPPNNPTFGEIPASVLWMYHIFGDMCIVFQQLPCHLSCIALTGMINWNWNSFGVFHGSSWLMPYQYLFYIISVMTVWKSMALIAMCLKVAVLSCYIHGYICYICIHVWIHM